MYFRLPTHISLTNLAIFAIAGNSLGCFYRAFSIDNMLRLRKKGNVNLLRNFASNLQSRLFRRRSRKYHRTTPHIRDKIPGFGKFISTMAASVKTVLIHKNKFSAFAQAFITPTASGH